MEITREFLATEIAKLTQQRNHAHDVAVASQAAIDVMQGLMSRLDMPEQETPTFADLGLSDPVPVEAVDS